MKNTRPRQPVTSTDGPLPAVNPADHMAPMPGRSTEPALRALVNRHAQCSDGRLDPDQWFPVSADPGQARQEAAAAIAVCLTCPVRGHCLTLSLQHQDIGQHGIWGGLIAADRARLRRRMAADQTAGRGITAAQDDDPAVMSRV
jgi:Transcription factor WhiB